MSKTPQFLRQAGYLITRYLFLGYADTCLLTEGYFYRMIFVCVLCVCAFVSMTVVTCVIAYVYNAEDNRGRGCWSSPSSLLETGSLGWFSLFCQDIWLTSFQRFSCLCLPYRTWITNAVHLFYMGSQDLNLGPHTCTAKVFI